MMKIKYLYKYTKDRINIYLFCTFWILYKYANEATCEVHLWYLANSNLKRHDEGKTYFSTKTWRASDISYISYVYISPKKDNIKLHRKFGNLTLKILCHQKSYKKKI